MKHIGDDPGPGYRLFEHEGEQRWLRYLDLATYETIEEAWDSWTPEVEAQRRRYLAMSEKFMDHLASGEVEKAVRVLTDDDLLLPL